MPSIGGRYSVLSKFGMVPAAAIGLDVERLLAATQPMERACGADVPPADNPGVQLGVALGVAATKVGRDKVTIVASPAIGDLGAWLEQLLAESTGKHGNGVIPLATSRSARPTVYGKDRFFAYLELDGKADPAHAKAMDALEKAGHPVVRITVKDIWNIGQEFFRWEMATAVAGAIIGINPFDQPDVEASKVKTRALTDAYEKTQALPAETPLFQEDGIALYADPRNAAELGRHNTLTGYLKSHFGRVHAGASGRLRGAAGLHRTQQGAYAGADRHARAPARRTPAPRPASASGRASSIRPARPTRADRTRGVFLQITCDDPADLPVPGHRYSFGIVKAAQARGDLDVLVERGRRVLRVHLKDVGTGLAELAKATGAALE